MKIIWSDFASNMLKDIFQYYKEEAGIRIAKSIKGNIFVATKPLLKHPKIGQKEISLEKLNEEYRYLICSNYKIIYKEVKEGILITDIFDTRQNPTKIRRNK